VELVLFRTLNSDFLLFLAEFLSEFYLLSELMPNAMTDALGNVPGVLMSNSSSPRLVVVTSFFPRKEDTLRLNLLVL